MKFVWPGNWTLAQARVSRAGWRHPVRVSSRLFALFLESKVSEISDLTPRSIILHIPPLTTHLMTYKIVWDYWNAFRKYPQKVENNWLTNYLNKRNAIWTWTFGLSDILPARTPQNQIYFSSYFLACLRNIKTQGNCRYTWEVRLEPFRTDATYFFFEYLFLKHGQWKETGCW